MPTNMPAPAPKPAKPAASPFMDKPKPAMSMPKGKKLPLGVLIGAAVGLLVGYGAGRVSTGTPLNPLAAPGSGSGSYQDGYNAAKKKIDDLHIFPPAPTKTMTLDGAVKSVGTDSFVLSAALTTPNPLDALNAPIERTVSITKDTKLMKMVALTQAEYQKEVEAFQKSASTATVPSAPPSSYKLEPISLSDLKVGDKVTVVADHDILKETSFTAVEIDVSDTTSAAPALAAPAQAAPPAGTPSPNGTAAGAPGVGVPPAGSPNSGGTSDGTPGPGTPPAGTP